MPLKYLSTDFILLLFTSCPHLVCFSPIQKYLISCFHFLKITCTTQLENMNILKKIRIPIVHQEISVICEFVQKSASFVECCRIALLAIYNSITIQIVCIEVNNHTARLSLSKPQAHVRPATSQQVSPVTNYVWIR